LNAARLFVATVFFVATFPFFPTLKTVLTGVDAATRRKKRRNRDVKICAKKRMNASRGINGRRRRERLRKRREAPLFSAKDVVKLR